MGDRAKEIWRGQLAFPLALLAAVSLLVVLTGAVAAAKAPEEVMRANCGTCHGQKGEGGTSWIDVVDKPTAPKIAGQTVMNIKQVTRSGYPPVMPAFPAQEISDSELNDLAMYIHMLPGSYISEPTAQATVIITDEDPWYNPMQVEINVGDTVKFVNTGKTYHPVTQVDFVATRGASGTDSGLLGPNGVYYRTFNTAGKYTFL